jgi:hypothetical protein
MPCKAAGGEDEFGEVAGEVGCEVMSVGVQSWDEQKNQKH